MQNVRESFQLKHFPLNVVNRENHGRFECVPSSLDTCRVSNRLHHVHSAIKLLYTFYKCIHVYYKIYFLCNDVGFATYKTNRVTLLVLCISNIKLCTMYSVGIVY